MTSLSHTRSDGSKRYRFVVRGVLSRRIFAAFPEMDLTVDQGDTRIEGVIADQVHLHGILEHLRNLGIELVSVNPVAD